MLKCFSGTHLEEITNETSQLGNPQDERKLHTLLTTEESKDIERRIRLPKPKNKLAGVSQLTIEKNYTSNVGTPKLRYVEQKRELEPSL